MVMIFNPSLTECSDIPKKKKDNSSWLRDKNPTKDKEPKCVFAKK